MPHMPVSTHLNKPGISPHHAPPPPLPFPPAHKQNWHQPPLSPPSLQPHPNIIPHPPTLLARILHRQPHMRPQRRHVVLAIRHARPPTPMSGPMTPARRLEARMIRRRPAARREHRRAVVFLLVLLLEVLEVGGWSVCFGLRRWWWLGWYRGGGWRSGVVDDLSLDELRVAEPFPATGPAAPAVLAAAAVLPLFTHKISPVQAETQW